MRGNPAHIQRAAALAIGFCCAASAGEPVAPLFTPVTQNRSISVQAVANGPFGSDSQSAMDMAADFGRFDSGRSVLALADPVVTLASATQDSDILDDCVIGEGHVNTFAGGQPGSDGFAIASSVLSFTFDVLKPAPFSLTGELLTQEDFPPIGPAGVMSLLGPGGYLVNASVNNRRPHVLVDWTGELTPGRYTLLASVSSDAIYHELFGSNAGMASFELTFCVIPEPSALALLLTPWLLSRRAPVAR